MREFAQDLLWGCMFDALRHGIFYVFRVRDEFRTVRYLCACVYVCVCAALCFVLFLISGNPASDT